MATTRLKIAIFLSYAIFAVMLNSVGTVILQSIEHFHIDKISASTLEGFKDLPIAITSFLVASFLPRFGYRRGMMVGLALVALACLAMPLVDSFWMTRLLFLSTGIGFALTKVGVYSLVGLLTDTPRGHAGLLNTIEGMFMLGVLSGYWIFSAFIDAGNPGSPAWLGVYWWLAGAAALAIVLLATSPFDEAAASEGAETRTAAGDFRAMLALATKALTLVFILSIFLYVLIEQGIGTWLPTFNREMLHLSAPMSVQAASIFAVGLTVGRLGAGVIVRRTGWYPLLNFCLVAMAVLIVVALPLAKATHGVAITTWAAAPAAAFVFPLIGLFMAPIYPALNSAILSAMPRAAQSAMVGLIVVFSALGGTTGSLIVGRVFAAVGGTSAFYLMLIPIAGIIATIAVLRPLVAADSGDPLPKPRDDVAT
ncbi:FHS family glucose/mannose:H+ symporter-like MFS transporter [Sphingomonas sp. UYAg733]